MIPRNIAKAIWAIDVALFGLAGKPMARRLNESRVELSRCLTELGYEFAKSDSCRIKRIKK